MKQYKQNPEAKWWKQSMNSHMYRIREYSAVFILIWATYMILVLVLRHEKIAEYFYIFFAFGLIGALIHSVTWFFVTPRIILKKVTPLKFILLFLFLIIIWLGLTAEILINR